MVCACVDIGTNTTRVLVADVQDGRLTEVLQQRAFTRLGMAPEIAAEKIAEVAGVVAEQVALARASGAQGVRVVATAAIRAAVNRDEFVAGMPVEGEILDEDQEGRVAVPGAAGPRGGAWRAGSRSSTRTRRRGWRFWAPPRRSPTISPARSRSSTSAAARPRSR